MDTTGRWRPVDTHNASLLDCDSAYKVPQKMTIADLIQLDIIMFK